MKLKVGEVAKRREQKGTTAETDWTIFPAASCCEPSEIFVAPAFSN
jgi:hypothetical protein